MSYKEQIRKIKRGDIYYANLNPVIGSEQGGTRPVLIISNDVGNKHSPTVIVAPITSRIHTKAKLPNWTVCERYIDEGITGTQAKKRPAFLKMIEDAKQGKFDLIVTREVCRFARNVVDTLVVTRELKGIGVEVFFIDDNIWTMDGDGELRLSLMATLAQEESRKTSERVKAGQKISRDNGVLYGNGNILGYDRVGDTYVINEEQAETVRMIYDLYLQGYGSMKIAKILTERKRKTASGLIKWSVSNIMRAIKNATYTGTKCYNKSRSNNFLEQKRINNLDMSTYEYVEGDFPSIISQEIWDKAQAIRESRVKPVCVSAGKNTHSKRDSRDIWVNKLRCSCGSSYRKNKWHFISWSFISNIDIPYSP